jgi:hypothetical protein
LSEIQSRLNALVAWTQEELGARRRMLGWLERQERAVVSADSTELESATHGLAAEIALQGERGVRRQKIFGALASAWSVPAGLLTLSAVVERAGPAARGLADLRGELREAAAAVLKKNRRIAALVRVHRRVIEDVIRVLVDGVEGGPLSEAGHLVDAEG